MKRKRSLGQQIIFGLVVLLGIGATLAVGFLLAQSGGSAEAGEAASSDTTRTPTPSPTSAEPDETATATPTSAIILSTGQSTTEPPPPMTNTRPPASPSTTEEACGPPSGWVTYTVQAGENLFRIGLRYGQNVNQMMQANCLDSSQVSAGQTLYVPPVTPKPPSITETPTTQTGTPAEDETPQPVSGCDNSGAQITAPASGETLTGDIEFYGTATTLNFSFYKLEIRPEGGTDFITFTDNSAETAVKDGFLGSVGAYAFPPGDYEIRLAVVDTTSAVVAECSIFITLQGGATTTPSS